MREGWRQAPLGELCEITKGLSPTLKTAPGPYPLIVTGAVLSSSNSYQFEGAAVCVPLVSSTGHGHASLKRVHYASGRFAVANIIAACVPYPSSGVDARFLFHYLQHFKDDLIVSRMKGTANVSLSIRNLAQVPILLPPLDDQRRLVDMMEAVDDAIRAAKREAAAASTVELATAARVAGERVPLGALLTGIEAGTSPKALDRPPTDDERGVLKVSAVGNDGFRPEEAKSLAESTEMPERARVRNGDLLMTRASGALDRVGITCLVDSPVGNLYLSDKTLRLVPDTKKTSAAWLNTMLRTANSRAQIASLATGSDMRNLSQAKARLISLPVPDLNVQRTQALVFEQLRVAADTARATADALRNLRTNLLTVLLSGEHEIPASYDELLELA